MILNFEPSCLLPSVETLCLALFHASQAPFSTIYFILILFLLLEVGSYYPVVAGMVAQPPGRGDGSCVPPHPAPFLIYHSQEHWPARHLGLNFLLHFRGLNEVSP